MGIRMDYVKQEAVNKANGVVRDTMIDLIIRNKFVVDRDFIEKSREIVKDAIRTKCVYFVCPRGITGEQFNAIINSITDKKIERYANNPGVIARAKAKIEKENQNSKQNDKGER